MAVTTFALLAALLVGFTLVVMGLQMARGDEEEEDQDEIEDERNAGDPPEGDVPELPPAPRLSDMAPGEAPTTALPVDGEQGVRAALATLHCECGSPGSDAAPRFSEMRLGARALVSARWSCPRCALERTVYFEPQRTIAVA